MLRSYQYTEKSYLDYSMQNNIFQMKEIDIARRYVESHHIRKDLQRDCPICGSKQGKYFFTKWNVDYLCCEKCDSLYAVCDEDVVTGYLFFQDLLDFRLSEEYQLQIAKSRQTVWSEFLEWVEVRAYRFLGRNRNLNIIDIGNRLSELVKMTKNFEICGKYELMSPIYKNEYDKIGKGEADVVFYNDAIKTEFHPSDRIQFLKEYLKEDGLLFIGARAGSGFDIITLKENNTKIYPYEHILLPSAKGITKFLEDNGFEVLEITTPGVMDVKYVLEDIDKLGDQEEFVKYLLKDRDETKLQEFQRFLQKSCMSSFIRVIARKARS